MASKERQLQRWSRLREQPVFEELTCFICSHKDTIRSFKQYISNDIFHAGTLVRYECPNCTVIFGDLRFLMLPQEEINRDYEDVYSYYGEGDTMPYILTALSSLDFFKDKSLSILDFACGKWNRVIPHLRSQGYNIIGYDKYVGGKDYILNTLPIEKFDIIYSCSFIEHMITPMQTITEMLSLIKKNGYLIFISDGFDYNIPYTHYHTFFFNQKSLKYIATTLSLELTHYIDFKETKMAVFRKL